VTKVFGGLVALNKVDFRIGRGELIGLIGPNGAGKTTLFHVVSGIYHPDYGSVLFKGEDISKLRPDAICRRGLARTFQIVRPFSHMTVIENVMVGAIFGRNPRDKTEAERRSAEILDSVGLSEKRGAQVGTLTLADRKRLEVARALATDPELILLDEVMSGLTPTEITQAMALIKKLNDAGTTLLLIEHVMKVIMEISHRIVVLDRGQKIMEGSPREVAADERVRQAYLGERYAV
jgi:branched-chain amino acid transport system ATP-binding protein